MWALTLTGPIRPSQDGALLDLAEGLEEPPDVILALLLSQHSHEQLPVLWMVRMEGGRRRGGGREERRDKCYSCWHHSAELRATCASQHPPSPLPFYQHFAVLEPAAAAAVIVDLSSVCRAAPRRREVVMYSQMFWSELLNLPH